MGSTKIMLTGVVLLLLANLFLDMGGGLSFILMIAGLLVFAIGLLYKDNDLPAPTQGLPQKTCPHCGREHDFDYAACPHCGQSSAQ